MNCLFIRLSWSLRARINLYFNYLVQAQVGQILKCYQSSNPTDIDDFAIKLGLAIARHEHNLKRFFDSKAFSFFAQVESTLTAYTFCFVDFGRAEQMWNQVCPVHLWVVRTLIFCIIGALFPICILHCYTSNDSRTASSGKLNWLVTIRQDSTNPPNSCKDLKIAVLHNYPIAGDRMQILFALLFKAPVARGPLHTWHRIVTRGSIPEGESGWSFLIHPQLLTWVGTLVLTLIQPLTFDAGAPFFCSHETPPISWWENHVLYPCTRGMMLSQYTKIVPTLVFIKSIINSDCYMALPLAGCFLPWEI